MLNKHNLAIANLASKEESRFTLQGILVTPKVTVVTDGYQLCIVTLPDVSAESFPDVSNRVPGKAMADFQPFILPTKDALSLLKTFPKKGTIPVLQHAAIYNQVEQPVEEGKAKKPPITTVVATDLDRVTPIFAKMEGNYPDYQRILPKRWDNVFEIGFSAELLRKVVEQIEAFMDDDVHSECVLSFNGPNAAMQVFARNGEKQEMTAVVMPYRSNGLQNENYDRREKAEKALREYYFDYAGKVDRNDAVLLDIARHLFEPKPEPQKVTEMRKPVEAEAHEEVKEVAAPPIETDHPEPVMEVSRIALAGSELDGKVEMAAFAHDSLGKQVAKVKLWRDGFGTEIGTEVRIHKDYPGDKEKLRKWIRFLALRDFNGEAADVTSVLTSLENAMRDVNHWRPEANRVNIPNDARQAAARKLQTAEEHVKGALACLRSLFGPWFDQYVSRVADKVVAQASDASPERHVYQEDREDAVKEALDELMDIGDPSDAIPNLRIEPTYSAGPFTERMLKAQTIDEGQRIIAELEGLINSLEKSKGFEPLVGEGASGFGYVCLRMMNGVDRAKMIDRMHAKDAIAFRQLITWLEDAHTMHKAFDKLFARIAQERRSALGFVPNKQASAVRTPTSGATALQPAVGDGLPRPDDWNTWGAGKKAAWTRKHGRR